MDEEEVKFVYTIHITCLLELQTKVREDFIINGMAPTGQPKNYATEKGGYLG